MSFSVKSSLRMAAMAIAIAAGADAARSDTIVIAADPWCPFNCEPGSAKPGFMVELARAVFEPLGHTVTYETVNWSRALVETREGKYNAVFGATASDAEDFVFPTAAQGQSGNGYFVQAGNDWKLESPDSLQDKTIGLIRDYAYGDEIEAQIKQYAKADYASGDDALTTNIKKLVAGRLDIVVEDANVFNYTASELGLLDKTRLEKAVDFGPVYIAFSPAIATSKTFATQLDSGMAELRANGKLSEILSKYGLADWE